VGTLRFAHLTCPKGNSDQAQDQAAEIPIDLIEDDSGWSPYLSVEDALKLDTVRNALRRGELTVAAQYGRVFELVPVTT
jgi:hypothetical protein